MLAKINKLMSCRALTYQGKVAKKAIFFTLDSEKYHLRF